MPARRSSSPSKRTSRNPVDLEDTARPAEKAPPPTKRRITPQVAFRITRDERREAWRELGDEPLENLVAVSSPSVAALEWLLAEDALRDL